MVLALPIRIPTPTDRIGHIASMGIETEMFDLAARRVIAVVTNLHALLYLSILGHPDRTVCAKLIPLVANLAISAGIQSAGVNETRRF
jgi:hypothetical protein